MMYPRRSPILASRVGKPIPTDLAAWYRYNTGITSDSGTVSAWANQTGGEALVQATAANRPVNGSVGATIISNGDFASDTVWTKGSGWAIGSGVATATTSSAGLNQSITPVVGTHYLITYTITRTAGSVTPRFTGGSTVSGTARSAAGTFSDVITAVTGNNVFEFIGSGFSGTVDNVAVQPITADGTIYFDGIARFLKTASFTLNQPTTVYFLGRQVTFTNDRRIYSGHINVEPILRQQTTSPNLDLSAGALGPQNNELTLNEYGIVSGVANGANSLLQVGGGTPSTGNAGTNGYTGFTLGADFNNASPSNIQVKEVLIYGAAHDANQRAAVIAYLNMVNQL
jgi:hypothetical protein